METITRKYVKGLLKKRSRDSHKGDYGKVLIVAGSRGMAGAAVLGARAALASGAGLVSVSIDAELFPIVQTCVPCATCVTRPESLAALARRAVATNPDLKSNAAAVNTVKWDAVAIGPGLGTDATAVDTVKAVLRNAYDGILVVDADALNIIANEGIDMRDVAAHTIITPHPGEAARLLGMETDHVNADRAGAAAELAKRYGSVTVLKGHDTLVATADGDIYVNPTGNPGMATGGSGDVLTGVVVSLAGQGFRPLDAALAGVYIHGLAGDIKAEEIGEYGLTATDIAEGLPRAIKTL
ncbi:MAG: NAD(P)H-hydrate dehydratase [Clostridiales Family XIII bacterium]|jgi:NAD(P)H-hydrate epimerase|nr:NAD(P)H-hydrate dehydratase [Clostridiales Family XIII bacterium]